MKGKLGIKKTVGLLGCSVRIARRLCAGGGLEVAVKIGKDGWYVPTQIPIRLTGELRFAMAPREKRDEAIRKAAVVVELNSYLSLAKNRFRRKAAHREFASKKRVAERTLYRWRNKYELRGLTGLVDARGK